MKRNYVVHVPYGPAELVEAEEHLITDRSLTFKTGNVQVRQFNNRGGWYAWEMIES